MDQDYFDALPPAPEDVPVDTAQWDSLGPAYSQQSFSEGYSQQYHDQSLNSKNEDSGDDDDQIPTKVM